MMLHHPCTGARGANPHWTCINGQPRRGAGPREALEAQGDTLALPARRPYSYSHLPPDIKEGVAHRVHRLWDRFKNPACGLVDNASKDF